MTTLGRIVARTRERVEQKRREVPLDRVLAVAPTPGAHRQFSASISRPDGYNVIAEFKRRSPSRGIIREDLHPVYVAQGYEIAGAAALSILTEEEFFAGSLDDLQQARQATLLPTLRKDFIVDPYQVWESWVAGADAVLLIVAVLSERELKSLFAAVTEAGLEALVEVHDEGELARALELGVRVLGVNCRDLRTLEVSLETAVTLAPLIPDDVVAVAESGIRTGADLRRLRASGYDAFLIGERLMESPDPGTTLEGLLIDASGSREKRG
jgi:indole-3-glycerol phosphate synthase